MRNWWPTLIGLAQSQSIRRVGVVLLMLASPFWCAGSVTGDSAWPGSNEHPALVLRERQLWKSAVRGSQFADITHTGVTSRCEASKAPEALTTPDPLLYLAEPSAKVTVSFIIGIDGRIYSPLILESAGSTEDQNVLSAVRSWRYRPARCNGVPTETEGKIEFSRR